MTFYKEYSFTKVVWKIPLTKWTTTGFNSETKQNKTKTHTKTKNKDSTNPREGRGSDFQISHIVIFKCLVFNKTNKAS